MVGSWLITGASSGLGLAMTERLLVDGQRVAATVRRVDALEALQAAYGDRLWVGLLDVTDADRVRAVVGQAFGAMGRIDVVVSNAGYGLFGAGEEVSDAQIRQQVDTNLLGSIAVIRASLPHLRAQGGGRVMQVSSVGGQVSYPNFSVYHASKWGIEGFVEAVAQEVAGFGITFTLVEPGATHTGFSGAMVWSPALAAYWDTVSGAFRRAVADGGAFAVRGDAGRTAQAILDAAGIRPAPRRLTLGSQAYRDMHAALTGQLAELEGQRAVAFSADADA